MDKQQLLEALEAVYERVKHSRLGACSLEFQNGVSEGPPTAGYRTFAPSGWWQATMNVTAQDDDRPKPEVVIHEYREGYDVRDGANLSYYMPRRNADALYEHMRAERNGPPATRKPLAPDETH
jgi:hypothetical protein